MTAPRKSLRLLVGGTLGFCMLFGLIPPLIYGIWNSGVAALLLAAVVLAVILRMWGVCSPLLRRGLLLLICIGLGAACALSALMIRQAWFSPPPADAPVPVVVLGGGIRGDRPSLMLSRRLQSAAAYLQEHPQAVCVVSGGQGPDEEYPEAQVMAAYLEELGIAPQRILQESASSNTQENLAFSRVLLEEVLSPSREIVLATDGFHQLRGAMYASQAGLKAYAVSSSTPWGLLPAYWVREWMALPAAWMILQSS